MLYTEFVKKAIDTTIAETDSGLFYLEPMWRIILQDNELFVDKISDYNVDILEVKELLDLEVAKRNAIRSNKIAVINWLYDIITTSIEPTILAEETDYVKQVVEFMKANREAKLSE